jgi:hypothetical protein
MKEVFCAGSEMRRDYRSSQEAPMRGHVPWYPGTRHAFRCAMTALLSLLPDDRPRERLAALGPECLADAELVALLLGSGRRGENALELAASRLRSGACRGWDRPNRGT